MAKRTNRRIVLVKRPEGEATPDCMQLVEEPAPEPAEGEALVKNLYLSLDPTQQGWMKYDTYMPAIPIGDVIRSSGVGEVIESRSPLYAKGQLVSGLVGWQEYALADGAGRRMQAVPAGVSPVDAVSLFGITGLTAYFGLLDVGKPKPGETVVVSGAAGATGLGGRPDREALGLSRGGDRGQRREVPLAHAASSASTPSIDYKREDVGSGAEGSVPEGRSTSTSTTSAGRSSTRRCSSSPAARASRCAARSRPTARRSRRRARAT